MVASRRQDTVDDRIQQQQAHFSPSGTNLCMNIAQSIRCAMRVPRQTGTGPKPRHSVARGKSKLCVQNQAGRVIIVIASRKQEPNIKLDTRSRLMDPTFENPVVKAVKCIGYNSQHGADQAECVQESEHPQDG